MKKTTPMTIRSLKRQSEFLYLNAQEFTEILDQFVRGSVLQSTEGLQSMRDLSRTRLAEQMRSERARYSTNRRSNYDTSMVSSNGPIYTDTSYVLAVWGNSYSGGWTPYGSPNR
jgi:hypothetical protein